MSYDAHLVIEIEGRLPSWNQILAMETWARYKFKNQLQEAFLSSLRASAGDSLTRTTYAKNTMSIAADTLACYRATNLAKRKSKSASKKLAAKSANLSASKSTK